MGKPVNPQWGYRGGESEATSSIRGPTRGADGVEILLETTKRFPAANEAFSPSELDRIIEAHAERVAAESGRLMLARKVGRSVYPAWKDAAPGARLNRLLVTIGAKLVSCGCCRKTLLAESEEWRRAVHLTFELPPSVAMRAGKCAAIPEGRPYCGDCLDRPVRAVVLVASNSTD